MATHPLIVGRLRADTDYRPLKKVKLESHKNYELPSHEEISSISLVEFDNRVAKYEEVRQLTCWQVKFIKDTRRIIKNREYARISRIKKNQLVTDLQQRVHFLEQELRSLHESYVATIGQNISLLTELEQHKIIKNETVEMENKPVSLHFPISFAHTKKDDNEELCWFQ